MKKIIFTLVLIAITSCNPDNIDHSVCESINTKYVKLIATAGRDQEYVYRLHQEWAKKLEEAGCK